MAGERYSLVNSGDFNNAAVWSPPTGAPPRSGQQQDLIFETPGATLRANGVPWADYDTELVAATTLELGGAGAVQVLGPESSFVQKTPDSTYSIVSAKVENYGDWDIGGPGARATARLVISQNATFDHYGTLEVDGSLLVRGGGDGTFVNNGSVKVEHGVALFANVATGGRSGSFVIGEEGTLNFTGKAGNAAVTFEPGENGKLLVGNAVDPSTFKTVIGFDAGDTIQVQGNGEIARWAQAPADGNAPGGTLTVAGAGGAIAAFNMTGQYAADAFAAKYDPGSGLTTITTTKAAKLEGPTKPEPDPGPGPRPNQPPTTSDGVLDFSDHGRRDAALTTNAANDVTVRLHDETIRGTAVQRIEFVDGAVTYSGGDGTQGRYEADPEASQIARMYYTVLGRAPEFDGLFFWVEKVMEEQNRSLGQVAPEFYTSREFKARYGENTSDQQFVTLLYQNILGRDPAGDPGLQFWLGSLAKGSTRPDIVVGISESPEHKNLRAAAIDDGIQLSGNPWLNDTSLLLL